MAMAACLSQYAPSASSGSVFFKPIDHGAWRQQAQWSPRSSRCGLSIRLKRNCPSRVRILVSCDASGALKLADTEPISLPESLHKVPASQGVYAVYDNEGRLQYIGISRRISTSVQGHIRDLAPELCTSVKVVTMDDVDRDGLRQAWEAWIREHVESTGQAPPGNVSGNSSWAAKRKPAKGDLKLKPSRSTQLTIPLEELVDKVVKAYKVVVFIKGSRTAPQCGFSHRVLTILNDQGVDFESVNVLDEEHNAGVREAVKVYSEWPTIPQVFVNGEFIGGADVLAELVETGEAAKLFK